MKLLYKKEKYRRYNKQKSIKLERKNKRKKLRQNKAKRERALLDILLSTRQIVTFPQNLSIAEGIVFSLIETAEEKDNIALDFSRTKNIDIGSAIYVKAFVDSLKDRGYKYQVVCLAKNKKMRQILQHIGIKNYGIAITHSDIKCWEIRSWHKNDKVNYGKVMMEDILPRVLKDKSVSAQFSDIAASLQELLSNCAEHAYIETDQYKNYYLIAGEYTREYDKSNMFTFCIIDRGQGFRATLEKKGSFKRLIENFISAPDANLLKAAVEGKFTSKKGGGETAGRGTGLSNVAEGIKDINGYLCVYSDKGWYAITRKKEEHLSDGKTKIKGSVIEMGLPITDNKG